MASYIVTRQTKTCRRVAFIMGILFSYAYDVDSKSVSDRLAVLMHAAIENDTYVQHNAYIKCTYKGWNDLVMKFLCDKPTDQMLAEIFTHFPDGDCFNVGHVMCICAFVSDVLMLNNVSNAEGIRTARMMACKMVQKNKTVCKLYLRIILSGQTF